MSIAARRIATVLLLLVGVQFWLLVGRSHWGSNLQLKILLAEFILAALPPIHRPLGRLLAALRHPSPRTRTIIAWCVVPIAVVYLYISARQQGRMLYPHVHDERMYMLQAQMLATGRLWMHQLPAADSFETFYVIAKPIYAAMYFPGAAMMYAVGVVLRFPIVLMPLLIAGASVGFLFRVVSELIDAVEGALAALMLLALADFRYVSTMYMSHSVMLLLGLMLTWAWLNWRRKQSLGWAIAIGAFAGWAAITRPPDAVCYALPIGVAILIGLRSLTNRRGIATIALIVAGAIPFLALQLVFDYGVTGHVAQTPVDFYNSADSPGVRYGFNSAVSPNVRPQSQLPQKQALFDDMVRPQMAAQQQKSIAMTWLEERFPWMALNVLPSQLLLILLPIGLLAARPKHVVLIALLPLFVICYAGFAWLLAHYCLMVVPAVCLLVLLSDRAIVRAWPRYEAAINVAFTLGIATVCIFALPQVNRLIRDDWWFHPPVVRWDHDVMPTLVQSPALVMYRFYAGNSPYDEPVYNIESANPDDAAIVRAHDLSGGKNLVLFEYYARVQPGRRVYLVDRNDTSDGVVGDVPIRYLGTAAELAKTAATRPAALTTTGIP